MKMKLNIRKINNTEFKIDGVEDDNHTYTKNLKDETEILTFLKWCNDAWGEPASTWDYLLLKTDDYAMVVTNGELAIRKSLRTTFKLSMIVRDQQMIDQLERSFTTVKLQDQVLGK